MVVPSLLARPWLRIICLVVAIALGLSSVRLSLMNHDRFQVYEEAAVGNYKAGTSETHYTVTIVGAGAAGLNAARILRKHGVKNVKILEASQVFGGRVRKDMSFVGLPLDLGPSFLGDFGMVTARMKKRRENSTKLITVEPLGTGGHVFVNYSWYDFFADYIAPKRASETIVYGCVVDSINYEGSMTNVSCAGREQQQRRSYLSNYTIVTVSLQMLRDKVIAFEPSRPIKHIVKKHPGEMWKGFKIFFEFTEKFWKKSFCFFDDIDACEADEGESFFWEYPLMQQDGSPLDTYIVAGYIMGKALRPYIGLNESALVKKLLSRTDKEFGGNLIATRSYRRHMLVNWTNEPFIRGTYASAPYEGGVQSVQDKVFLAGEAFPAPGGEQGWVHGAYYSGQDAAKKILHLMRSSSGDSEHS